MISRNTLRPNLEMMIQGTPLNVIRECCSGKGFKVSITPSNSVFHKDYTTNTYQGRRPRRGNLIIHQRWSVVEWDISSYIRPKLDIPLPDTIVKTRCVEKEKSHAKKKNKRQKRSQRHR